MAALALLFLQSADNSDAIGLVLILVLGALYFLPVVVATVRNCKATAGVFVVNLFLGWTLIGWVVALAWAASGDPRPRPEAVLPDRASLNR